MLNATPDCISQTKSAAVSISNLSVHGAISFSRREANSILSDRSMKLAFDPLELNCRSIVHDLRYSRRWGLKRE